MPTEGEDMKTRRRTRNRRRIAVMGLGVLAAGAVAVPALASQTVKIDSKVTLAVDAGRCHGGQCSATAFHGRVKSSRHACEVHRTVKVFNRQGTLIGKDRSSHRGRWRVLDESPHAGNYHAKVLRREEGTAGTNFVCRGDRSKVVDWD